MNVSRNKLLIGLPVLIGMSVIPSFSTSKWIGTQSAASTAAPAALNTSDRLIFASASGDSAKSAQAAPPTKKAEKAAKSADASSAAKKDLGIGPIKELKLGPIDPKLVDQGAALFTKKCTTCHLMDTKKIGPPLRDVTKQETPEFIMNMLLNTDQMEKKNPRIKKLISELQVYMTVLDLTNDEARALLEYLRSEGEKPKS